MEKLWHIPEFELHAHSDFELEIMILVVTNPFSERVVIFTDYALRIFLGTFPILLRQVHDTRSWSPIVWNIIQIQHRCKELYGPNMGFNYDCLVTLTMEIWSLIYDKTSIWVMDNNIIQIQNLSMEWRPFIRVLASFLLWPWPLRYNIWSK